MDSRRAQLILDCLFWLGMFLTAALMAFLGQAPGHGTESVPWFVPETTGWIGSPGSSNGSFIHC